MIHQKVKLFSIATLLTISIFLAGSCRYDKAELLNSPGGGQVNCANYPAKYRADILPLLTRRCATPYCHNTDASGGIVLQNYAKISAAKARIYQRAVVEKSMPLNFPLQPAELNLLKCWIDNGAKDN